ncbi:hypothetical protein CPAST_c37820 [Clostridium pasteurianum DSM 525 = ATCC 6013]|uniref:Uncharacterized protein n=1 Tax=Clostridium pasteurianum DSM 525 = ATCC 6013 TaxID=1262449 RepID=A0A0H3JBJ1_CLOPA|nr:hypothetical protein [Clostridium pasteurianum]AJA49820.1 hypothetical protein CPAST_c37820 [Clostridium pasteurianum DSM 525 = ATCC 6013]AJA53808.1 hypothetical protein CLPA_c37820 [Clostridium pasteurianum DSM 525 = ATCC 6013]AOZ76965.1 hypothetical protein AQ983_18390 [Clostridium pasteurianum DSM 525 = ATCC 6013]AOZ80762.1 hypothetical protein AQ984_18385 [Clostridium pasteurianum]ELP57779.1 hypothetical protein F502_17482 [Clostridium pasteurianum DSM 525 = ATCC 6013]
MELSIVKNSLKTSNLKEFGKIALSVLIIGLAVSITGSALIGSVLGVSATKVLEIAWTVYRAYRAGSSIAAAVGAIFGPGYAAWFLAQIFISYGISVVLNSPGLRSY